MLGKLGSGCHAILPASACAGTASTPTTSAGVSGPVVDNEHCWILVAALHLLLAFAVHLLFCCAQFHIYATAFVVAPADARASLGAAAHCTESSSGRTDRDSTFRGRSCGWSSVRIFSNCSRLMECLWKDLPHVAVASSLKGRSSLRKREARTVSESGLERAYLTRGDLVRIGRRGVKTSEYIPAGLG